MPGLRLLSVIAVLLVPVSRPEVTTRAQTMTAIAQNANLNTSLGTLHGTWLVPDVPGRMPIVLLIPGAGPIDRDGNSTAGQGKTNNLKMLAEALAARGVASLRYDKRGVGRSARPDENEADFRFEDDVNDAANIVDIMRGEARYANITVVGHGEGALVGMLAARLSEAEGFVSIGGSARGAAELLRDQLRQELAATPAAWQAAESMLLSLERGELKAPPRALNAAPAVAQLFRRSAQPYLISWFAFRPTSELARLQGPVLIIHGATDLQVPVSDAEALKAARPTATLLIIPGMNHVMKAVDSDPARQLASYSDPTLPLVAAVPNAIAEFTRTVPIRPRLSR